MNVDTHLSPTFQTEELEKDVREGFAKSLKELPSKWLYDERGSELFEEITMLEEYYLTRREREILSTYAKEIAEITQADTLVELGSGNSEKTLILLEAMNELGHCSRFVPFDVSESALEASIKTVTKAHSKIEVHGVLGDFHHHLEKIPHYGKSLIIFLGGTIGNFRPTERKEFISSVVSSMDSGDYFLLGTDLVKDKETLEAAYNDSKGVTAEFNLNMLRVLNQELDGDFKLGNFSHRSFYNEDEQWIEMRLKSECQQEVVLDKLNMCVSFSPGEEILTEISAKFLKVEIAEELEAVGFQVEQQWTDVAGDYLITLALVP